MYRIIWFLIIDYRATVRRVVQSVRKKHVVLFNLQCTLFLIYFKLELEIAPSSDTVTAEEQRVYLKIETLQSKPQQKTIVLKLEICGELLVDRSMVYRWCLIILVVVVWT